MQGSECQAFGVRDAPVGYLETEMTTTHFHVVPGTVADKHGQEVADSGVVLFLQQQRWCNRLRNLKETQYVIE